MINKFVIGFLITVFCLPAIADQYTVHNSDLVYVYDVDTFFIDIPMMPEIFGKRLPIRIRGIDGPEILGKCQYEKDNAIIARDFLRELFNSSETLTLSNFERGKYFRLVSDVFINYKSVATILIENNLVRKYDGKGKRKGWCDDVIINEI